MRADVLATFIAAFYWSKSVATNLMKISVLVDKNILPATLVAVSF